MKIYALIIAAIAAAGTAVATAASLHDAAEQLEAGETKAAVAELLAYGRGEPTAPLANQALDCVLLINRKKTEGAVLGPYVETLAVLADGYATSADAAFREMAVDDDLPWAIRGRAALLAADLNTYGDRVEILEAAWRDCDDETARLVGVALGEAYNDGGRADDARAVRDAYARRFPGDAGLKYFDYLSESEDEGK